MSKKLRFLLTLTFVLAALSFAFTGCEIEEDSDTDGGTTTPEDTAGGEDTNNPTLDYRFVRIDDLSDYADTPQGGADIDAVVLQKTSGETHYAENVEGFVLGSGSGDAINSVEALGAPDAFYNYTASGDASVCNITGGQGDSGRPFVSLNGEGGTLVVRMSGTIEAGDNLTVLEVGGCDFDDDGEGTAIIEEIQVRVSVTSNIDDGQWESLGTGTGPEVSFTVPALPEVPAN